MKRKLSSIQILGQSDIQWDQNCEAWTLFEGKGFDLFQGKMPVGSKDEMHTHADCEQFLYVFSGEATLEFSDQVLQVNAFEGTVIPQGMEHRLINHSSSEVEFLVISTKGSKNDRIENDT